MSTFLEIVSFISTLCVTHLLTQLDRVVFGLLHINKYPCHHLVFINLHFLVHNELMQDIVLLHKAFVDLNENIFINIEIEKGSVLNVRQRDVISSLDNILKRKIME